MTTADSSQKEEQQVFKCSSCGLLENYDYKGKKPPFSKLINFAYDSYTMKDPFSPPNKGQFLILGGDCAHCTKPVCQASECSIFYGKLYCNLCAKENIQIFPKQLCNRLLKSDKKS